MPITKKRKKLLSEWYEFACQQCHNKFAITDLQAHRITRKGSYENHANIKLLCKKCHRAYHQNE